MRAALDLFTAQGYDNTTVAEIAERAGLNKSTFFRHFRDKREVLFAAQDVLRELFADGIAAAPAAATPLEAVAAALAAAAPVFPPAQRDLAPQRRAVIAANPELQEREALKRADFAAALAAALRERGLPEPAASLAAELGVLAFKRANARWANPANQQPFDELARQSLRELQAAVSTLS
jgi:AcrR family transcriptional regulator